jgi:hypothetical protein
MQITKETKKKGEHNNKGKPNKRTKFQKRMARETTVKALRA